MQMWWNVGVWISCGRLLEVQLGHTNQIIHCCLMCLALPAILMTMLAVCWPSSYESITLSVFARDNAFSLCRVSITWMESSIWYEYVFLLLYESPPDQQPVTEVCLGCICEAISGCNQTATCAGDVCGLFRITWAYWADAGKPTVNGESPDSQSAYGNCANQPACAARCVQGYMARFGQVERNAGIVEISMPKIYWPIFEFFFAGLQRWRHHQLSGPCGHSHSRRLRVPQSVATEVRSHVQPVHPECGHLSGINSGCLNWTELAYVRCASDLLFLLCVCVENRNLE